MVSASVVDNRFNSDCFIESSDSNLLQPLKLCVPSPSPKLCVTPPTPNVVSPTSPPLPPQTHDIPKESLLQTVMGKHFPGVTKLKPKKKKSGNPVLVLPHYLAADSKVSHPEVYKKESSGPSRPEFVRHFSQPVVDLKNVALSSYYKRIGRSTQSLSLIEESSYRNLLQQEDMRAEAQHGNRIIRGLRAIRLFPQNKLSKRLIALKCKLQADASMDEEDVEESDSSLNDKDSSCGESDAKKPKVKFERKHNRSSSDSIADAIIKSLSEKNSGLDRVIEVKESPGSSPTSPSRKESYTGLEFSKHGASCTNFNPLSSGIGRTSSYIPSPEVHITVSESFLRLPTNDDGPELRYVDGHLISNTSSNISSTSDSSSSEEDASEDYSFDAAFKDMSKTPYEHPSPSPLTLSASFSFQVSDSCSADTSNNDTPQTENSHIMKQAVFDESNVENEKSSDVYYFDSSKPDSVSQQPGKITTLSSSVNSVASTTKSFQISDTPSVSVLKNNEMTDVPSSLVKTVIDTKPTSLESSSLFHTDTAYKDGIDNVQIPPVSETDSNLESYLKNDMISQKSENNCHPSITPIKENNVKKIEDIASHSKELSQNPSILNAEHVPIPETVLDVLHNQESVEHCTSVEDDNGNNLSIDGKVSVASQSFSPDSNTTSACNLDVVDVDVRCKTNSSVIGMQKWPVGKVNVVGMLNIPTSPLHKSQSASTLCSCPTATVEHDTNGEQASPCCLGDLQFQNIKHGPCFVLPSRQQQMQFSGGEEDKAPASSPPVPVPAPAPALGSKISPSPAKLSTLPGIHRRSSDSDLSITPKGIYFQFCSML